ncbi:AAA family ATPase [Prochlorococcus sp. MIT 1341]|uniref:AAA family ATPase n=1 Tax=Prochlorococcus sp. MIT 1341 TaxID=3096221 RepID=UPI002A7664B0|nr:AAA family ATPase [Prochlorococcus sp. MIT 1341]
MSQNIFEYQAGLELLRNAPLADRMRPKTLDEFEGQSGIVGEGRLLRRAIKADKVGNLLLHGPPGVGKTTLARIIAGQTRSHFATLNAVLAGVKDIRTEVDAAKKRLELHNLRSILFIDEVHRFNSSQQDALLPWVENGTISLIGATTENPYFEVNKALLSRSRIFRLKPLEPANLHQLLKRAISDRERGYGQLQITISSEAASHLVDISNGDARSLLNALELAVESTKKDGNGDISIDLETAEESIQERAVLYDKQGDSHYDTISAFIKSLRGSDADASLFWLAKMIEAGESPRFIFRRMLIAAGEDVGLADPQAIVVVEACSAAFERVGLPEGLYHLAQAALYLACAEKSNTLIGFFDALESIRRDGIHEIPSHLRDPNRDQKGFGDGANYRYPHTFKEHWVAQQYLPKKLQGKVFWKPSRNGWEGGRRKVILERKAAQLAAAEKSEQSDQLFISNSPKDPLLERWFQRQINQISERMLLLNRKLWSDLKCNREDRILVVSGRSLLWALEPIKAVPEGGVTMITDTFEEKSYLEDQIELIEPIKRPLIVNGGSNALKELPKELQFEFVGGRLSRQMFKNESLKNFCKSINSKCNKNAQIRFLISDACIGPAESLNEFMKEKNIEIKSKVNLRNLIQIEKEWLQKQSIKEELCNELISLGWTVKIEQWEESLSLDIDQELINRWLSEGSTYRSLIDKTCKLEELSLIKKIIKKLQGEKLPQKLNHQKLICLRI